MAFTMKLWENKQERLVEVPGHRLDREDRLEDWIEKDPSILGLDVLLIGRQVNTPYAGRIDLLAINRQGDLVVLELKRDRTPRDAVAQVLDYASWVHGLSREQVEELAACYLKGELNDAFKKQFSESLPDTINNRHHMVIVASALDDSSERIVQYLAGVHGLDINVVFFNCFSQDGRELVGRSWLMDPEQAEVRVRARDRTPISTQQFLADLADRRNENEQAVAEAIVQWSERQGLRPSSMRTGSLSSFIPVLDHAGLAWYPIWVQSKGDVALQMQYMRGRLPFSDHQKRLELMRRMNEIPGVSFKEDRMTGRPSIRLEGLLEPSARQRFLDVLTWMVQQIRTAGA
jgi:hypothetical protein